jgi:hypothetical protein
MAATPLNASTRFINLQHTVVYWVPTIASVPAPTRSELNAGTNLTGEIPDDGISGFSLARDSVDAPDMATGFVAQLPGRITAAASMLTFYRSNNSTDIRALLSVDLTGYIVMFPEGDTAGRKMDVFPVRVKAKPKDFGGNNPAKITYEFAITSTPSEDVTVPA